MRSFRKFFELFSTVTLLGLFSFQFSLATMAKEPASKKTSYVYVPFSAEAVLAVAAFQKAESLSSSKQAPEKSLSAGQKIGLPAELSVDAEGFLRIGIEAGTLDLAPKARVKLSHQSPGIKVTLIEGRVFWRGSSSLTVELPLLEPIAMSGQRAIEFEYDQERAKITVAMESGSDLEFKSYGQVAPPETLRAGGGLVFQARKDPQNRVLVDEILSEKRAVVGEWSSAAKDSGGRVLDSENSWNELQKKAEARKKRQQQAKARRVVRNYLCATPNGNFNECVYKRSSGQSGAGALCLRQRCLANGQWGSDFTYPVGQGPCEARDFVAPCDY